MPGQIPLGGQDIDLDHVIGAVVLFEYADGTQHGWRVDQLIDLMWRGSADDVEVLVRGRFHRMAKNPESRAIERQMHAVLGRGGYDPDDGRELEFPGR